VAARVTGFFWRARREVFERIGGATSVGVDRGAVVDDGIAQFLFLRYHAARLVVPDAGLPVASGGIVDDWASVSGKACAFIDVAISHRGGWGSRGTDSRGGPLFPDVSETDVDVFDRLLARVRTAASDVAEPMWRSDEIEFLRSLASYLETVAGDARVRAPALRREDSGTAPDNAVQATAVNKPARVAKSYLRAARHAFVVTVREQSAWLLIMGISIIAFGCCAVTLGPRHAALDARTFLGVPSHYDLARRRNQRVLIPLVYGIMPQRSTFSRGSRSTSAGARIGGYSASRRPPRTRSTSTDRGTCTWPSATCCTRTFCSVRSSGGWPSRRRAPGRATGPATGCIRVGAFSTPDPSLRMAAFGASRARSSKVVRILPLATPAPSSSFGLLSSR
jgi:hypothetical protein